jgi:hypothetical protein
MLAIETYIQNSMSSVSGKVCAVARLIAFASIATSFDIDASQASRTDTGPAGPVISEPILVEDEDQAKQLDYWHQHNA